LYHLAAGCGYDVSGKIFHKYDLCNKL
jgi:hypothetical protein